LQWLLAQSVSDPQVAHTSAVQRPLPQAASEPQGSPRASLQKPAWQTPLTQELACVQAVPKGSLETALMQLPPAAQTASPSQWLTRSSVPAGRSVQVPALPGIAHEVQVMQEAEPQHTDSTQVAPATQSLVSRHRLPCAQGGQPGPPQPTSVSVPASALQTGPPSLPAPPAPVVPLELEVEVVPLELVEVPVELELVEVPVELVLVEVELVVATPPVPPHVRRSPQSDES
jgi:hypothetical protein